MIRDPFYSSIIKELEKELDKELFERSAQVLLRQIYHTLVPISGGSDGGMDGSTDAIEPGEQIILVATAGEDLTRNIKGSIDRMLKEKNPARRVIFATSKKASETQRKKLREEAKNRGFQLVQIYDQRAIANLLYRSPEWCKELLGLSGTPSALSILPVSNRPTVSAGLVGREADSRALLAMSGHRLLVGQPGMGKTYLLSQLAREAGWLFVISKDLTDLANAIRAQKPSGLIVSDAHLETEFLQQLAHLLQEIGEDSPIVADCWPGGRNSVVEALQITRANQIELEPLIRPEVAEILLALGIDGPDQLVYHLLRQASGKPGLAVTLAHLCLEGGTEDFDDVLQGEALLRYIEVKLNKLVGDRSIEILASLALGGDSGFTMGTIADFLSVPASEVRRVVTGLAFGGLVSENNAGNLVVYPTALRYSLIKEVFYSGATSLDPKPLLQSSFDFAGSIEHVIQAGHRGAALNDDELLQMVIKSNSSRCWESFAWLGERYCDMALEVDENLQNQLHFPLIEFRPKLRIQYLLSSSIEDNRPTNSNPNHPIRLLEDWVRAELPQSELAIEKRKTMLSESLVWLEKGNCASVGINGVRIALTPGFRSLNTDPVLGKQVNMMFGLLTKKEIEEISSWWPIVIKQLKAIELDVEALHKLAETCIEWSCPGSFARASESCKETLDHIESSAKTMVRDCCDLSRNSPSVQQRLAGLVESYGWDMPQTFDEEFNAIYPRLPSSDFDAYRARQRDAINELAEKWKTLAPRNVVERVVELEAEAKHRPIHGSQLGWLGKVLCDKGVDKVTWAKTIIDCNGPSEFLGPFVQGQKCDSESRFAILKSMLDSVMYRQDAVCEILCMEKPNEELIELGLSHVSGFEKACNSLAKTNQLPKECIEKLLAHDEPNVAYQTAIGFWEGNKEKADVFRGGLPNWEPAVLQGPQNSYWLGELFKTRPDLAGTYIKKKIPKLNSYMRKCDFALCEALTSITSKDRLEAIALLEADVYVPGEFIEDLVSDDLDAFKTLLDSELGTRLKLSPLTGDPSKHPWETKVQIAISAGFSEGEIAESSIALNSCWGKESDMLTGKISSFEPFVDGKAGKIAKLIVENLTASQKTAKEKERAKQI